jgi:hypothetical protein
MSSTASVKSSTTIAKAEEPKMKEVKPTAKASLRNRIVAKISEHIPTGYIGEC